ncbi:MAG: hypothetical protein QMB39_10175 [Bacteroidales bacterium]
MNYKEEIENFVVKGFKNNNIPLITDNKHNFVLKNRTKNFITAPPKGFKYHRWAGSLKSSQAFAYNVFSGVNSNHLEFEFPMAVFDRDAQIDVMLNNETTNIIELFEVKAFEITQLGKNKIDFKEKYIDKTQYKRPAISEPFIKFLKKVIKCFEGQKIYGGGVKQICSHLLGIINIMNEPKYVNNKFILYSFCFDNPFSTRFEQDLTNYKETIAKFKNIVDEFLKDIKVNERVEYFGFLSASEYIIKNKEFLGEENYNYVLKRYFYKY